MNVAHNEGTSTKRSTMEPKPSVMARVLSGLTPEEREVLAEEMSGARSAAVFAITPERQQEIAERTRLTAEARAEIRRAVAVYDANTNSYPLHDGVPEAFEETKGRLLRALGLVANVRHHEDDALCGPEKVMLEDAMRLISSAHYAFEHFTGMLTDAGVIAAEATADTLDQAAEE